MNYQLYIFLINEIFIWYFELFHEYEEYNLYLKNCIFLEIYDHLMGKISQCSIYNHIGITISQVNLNVYPGTNISPSSLSGFIYLFVIN